MSTIIKLLTGTNLKNGERLLCKEFEDISSWSNNWETADHYYEGCMIEISIKIDIEESMEYILELCDLEFIPTTLKDYTYGFAEMTYPEGTIWYSFSKSYLDKNVISVKEIDLERCDD